MADLPPRDPVLREPVPADPAAIRRRQRAGARVTALVLGGLVILFFAISVAKIAAGHQ